MWLKSYLSQDVSGMPAIVCPCCHRRVVYNFWIAMGHLALIFLWLLFVRTIQLDFTILLVIFLVGAALIEFMFIALVPLENPER
jgi:hypothetical protein